MLRHTVLPMLMILTLALLGGCYEIRKIDDPRVVQSGGFDKFLFGDYWKLEDLPKDSPEAKQASRIAVAEFVIEFVTEKSRYYPDTSNVTRRVMLYDADIYSRLPDRLYNIFVQRIQSRGKELASKDDVRGAASYANYPFRDPGSPIHRFVTPQETDMGRISTVRLQPTHGLGVIKSSDPKELAELDRALMQELGVDLVVRASYRVGVHAGRATVEQGSRISITTKAIAGRALSTRSLASDKWVQDGGNIPSPTGEWDVSRRRFMAQVEPVFLAYIDLSLQTMGAKD